MGIQITMPTSKDFSEFPVNAQRGLIFEAQKLIDTMREVAPLGPTRALKKSFRVETKGGGETFTVNIVSTQPYSLEVFETDDGNPIRRMHVPRNQLGQTGFAELGGSSYKPVKGSVYPTSVRDRKYWHGVKLAHEGEIPGEEYVADYPGMALEIIGGIEQIVKNIEEKL